MKRHKLSNKAGIFIIANWLLFALCFAWTSNMQGNLTWWVQLNWDSWLTDLGALIQLSKLQAGTFWIVWFALGTLITIVCLPWRTTIVRGNEDEDNSRTVAQKQLSSETSRLESDPLLQEKILKLQQSLDAIR